MAQPAPLRPGTQLRNLGDSPDEPVPAWHRRRQHRPRGHANRASLLGPRRPPCQVQSGSGQSAVLDQGMEQEKFVKDPFGRNLWGVPPQGRADYAFFQHVAKSLDPETGRAAILFPHGVLFRREEAALREKLVRSDLLECVLGLGPGLFYNSQMEAVVITLRAQKAEEQQGKVLFINAVNEYAREQAQSFLRESHQQKILGAYEAFSDQAGFAAVATIGQIGERDYSLAMPLYVTGGSAGAPDEAIDIGRAVTHWKAAAVASDAALDDVIALLRQEAAQ